MLTRWFRSFGYVPQEELDLAVDARFQAQDRVRVLEAEVSRMAIELAEARKSTTDSVMHVADWLSQSMFGKKIYAETPTIQEAKAEPEIIRPKSQARQLCNQLEKKFFDTFEPVQ